MTTTKISALFMTMAIVLSLLGFTYAHWADTVQIEGKMKMAHVLIGIKSSKVLTSRVVERYSNVTYEVSSDEHTLAIHSENLRPCWYIWVGLVMQNQGPLPGKMKPPEYSYDPSDTWGNYFETTEYFYGSYPENTGFGTLEVWGRAKLDEELLSDGTVAFTTPPTQAPFTLDPTEKAIIWIWIHCKLDLPDDAKGDTITLYINIVDDMAI
ncbi:MAG: hypothetical protein JSV85_05490 [Candidatus Bathyarchaeota archaeon]|nr:MAG: hypothetical protein JSV85_05490 [Candidatus Bathyarchaeota archaeon]